MSLSRPRLLEWLSLPQARISIYFCSFSMLWIIASDWALFTLLSSNAGLLNIVSGLKGLLYVTLSTLLLYVLLKRDYTRRQASLNTLRREVDDHARTFAALQREHRLVQRILDTAPMSIVVVNRDAKIAYVNSAAERVAGLSYLELVNEQQQDARWKVTEIDGSPISADQQTFNIVRRTGQAVLNLERMFESVAGKRYISINAAPLYDERSEFDGMLTIIEDITERERQARRLRALHIIDKEILAASTLDAIAGIVLTHLRLLVPAFRTGIGLFDLERNQFDSLMVNTDQPTAFIAGTSYPVGAPFENIREHRSVLIDNNVTGATPLAPPFSLLYAEGMRSFCSVPLIARDTVLGVLNAVFDQPGSANDEVVQIVIEVARQLAIAIERTRLVTQLRQSNDDLLHVTRRLVEVQEAERRNIARELHDEVGQTLTGLSIALELAGRKMPDAAEEIHSAQTIVNDLMKQVRALSLELRPAMLDDLGLLPALHWLFRRFTEHTRIDVQFTTSGPDERLAPELETAVYRIVQESLTNVARYAHVDTVWVDLTRTDEWVTLHVKDQGKGFDVAVVRGTAATGGLIGMFERARMFGGSLTIDSTLGEGTSITARFPLSAVAPTEKVPQ